MLNINVKMKNRISIFVLLIICLVQFALYSFGSLPQNQSKDKEDLQHVVTVTLKLIQVYVTDKDGLPVMDLGIDDFELYDNKKRMELTEFEKYRLELPPVEKKPREAFVEPESDEEISPTEKMTRKLFLFFDFAFNNAKGIEKSKIAALHFIDTKLQPTDEIGILTYSVIHGLALHEFLTTNHEKVREVVEGFGTKDIAGRAYNVESIYWKMREDAEYPLADNSKQFFSLRRQQIGLDRKVYKEQASNFALKIEELSKALRYIPGNKYIIFFSSGIASSVMYGKTSFLKNYDFTVIRDTGTAESVIRNRYEGMLKELSSSNCTVFTMNVEELEALIHQDADTLGTTSLKQMAKKTGGRYYEGIHNYENIMEELQNLTSSYYVLGYYINEKWDGKYHKIKVKVKRNGCKVIAQGGYYNPKPFTKYSKLEKQLHLVDLTLTERPLFQDAIHFPIEATYSTEDDKYNLKLGLKMPAEVLTEISGKKVEIVSLIFDEKDNVVGLKREEMDFSKLPQEELEHYSRLSIVTGKYKCRVVIRNLNTGKGAVGVCSIEIPK
jgi:VWFA-related protein